MKKLMLTAALVLLSCGSAFAQFSNSSASKMKSSSSSREVNTAGYNKAYFQYNPSVMRIDYKGVDNQSFNGLALGFAHGFSLMSTQPLYLEVGGNLQFSFYKHTEDADGYYDDEFYTKWRMLSLNVPLHVTYLWQVADKVGLAPYTGFRLRLNLWGSEKGGYSGSDEEYDYYYNQKAESVNIFDKDKMGKDGVAKRFQIAWEIGLNIHINNRFYIGGGYAIDFMEYSEKTKIGTGVLTAGLIF